MTSSSDRPATAISARTRRLIAFQLDKSDAHGVSLPIPAERDIPTILDPHRDEKEASDGGPPTAESE